MSQEPFLAKIKERHSLCQADSKKEVMHIVLDLKGSNVRYDVGDSVAIFPENRKSLIKRTLLASKMRGDEDVFDRRLKKEMSLREYFLKRANLRLVTPSLLKKIAAYQEVASKKNMLLNLLDDRDALDHYVRVREVWDVLEEHREVALPLEELITALRPLSPRLYSAASSMRFVGDELHLAVALVDYQSLDFARFGACSHYLCRQVPVGEPVVPMRVQPHRGFTLPEDGRTSVIMVGAGTGIAPFRAFMQERVDRGDLGLSWLFFGEWNRACNFFYRDFWHDLEREGKLRLDLAFSRDQEHKIYVQDQMREKGKDVFSVLDRGGYIYVCGSALTMAAGVEEALLEIFQKWGNLNQDESKAYLKQLRLEKRYVKDVY